MVRLKHITIFFLILLLHSGLCFGAERFPPPDFVETDHQLPSTDHITQVTARPGVYEYIDVVVLVAALALASYLSLKLRSRRWMFALMIFSLAYFGFWRKGCICSIGAIQNFALSIFSSSYTIPLFALLFFILPLVFTIFFGRGFCAGVCPLGAIQDIVLLKPVSIPRWLESSLRLLAYLYLGGAVLLAATGSAFIICRYDPFVSFFRLSGNASMLILGGLILLLGVFIGRPYCRFLCPLGVIFRQFSRLSKWHVTITPDDCIKCRLCEDACPFGAINKPTANWPSSQFNKSKKVMALLIIALPLLVLLLGWAGFAASDNIARANPTVRLSDRIYLENNNLVEGTTEESTAFRATGEPVEELYSRAESIKQNFKIGSLIFGGFIGLVIGLKLITHSLQIKREDYEADRASCFACGRCFRHCPREIDRLKKIKEKKSKNDAA